MPWDPDRYHKFQEERSAPFEDLLRLVNIRKGLSVIDLGCGTGELTRKLADSLPASDVLGIDDSTDMLKHATKHARPGLRFELRSIQDIIGEWDLIFSNAAIHWLDSHDTLIPRLLLLVRPGGQLVVQVPSNHNHSAYLFVKEIAGEEPFRSALKGWVRESPVLAIDAYAYLLHQNGATDITVFEKVFLHVLEDSDSVADWTSGTSLLPYFERLDNELQDLFLKTYRKKLKKLWPSGPVCYSFRRIFFAATL